MNTAIAPREAVIGWFAILAGRPGGMEHFDLSRTGLITAVAYYLIVVIGLIIVDLVVPGVFSYDRLFVGVVLNSLPLGGVWVVAAITAAVLKPEFGTYGLLVPATYALTFQVVLGVPLTIVLGALIQYTLTGILGYMLFRLARYVGKLGIGVSIAFAALSIVALVGLPTALYMVLTPGPGAS